MAGEVPRKAQRLIDVTYECADARHRGGQARRDDRRHRPRDPDLCRERSAARWCAISAATASAACSTTCPTSCITAGAGEGAPLKPGMFFTVEPMINLGGSGVKVLTDGWTAVTRDRSLSAQFEHTVGVTETGVEIFTLSPDGARTAPPIRMTPERGRRDEAAALSGHRERLRARLREAGAGALADYELLELVLFRAIPRRDVKPLAKALFARFGSFAEAIAAEPAAAGRGRRHERRARSPSSRSSRPRRQALRQGRGEEAAADRLLERGRRLLPHRDGVREPRGISASCSSTSATA